jgi:APA family basic amino acid/polyamine antiporter
VNWARLFIWLVIGLVVYFMYSRHHSRVQAMQQASTKTAPSMAD